MLCHITGIVVIIICSIWARARISAREPREKASAGECFGGPRGLLASLVATSSKPRGPQLRPT